MILCSSCRWRGFSFHKGLLAPHASPASFLLLLHLLLSPGTSCATQSRGGDGHTAEVDSPARFVEALRNPAVTTILVGEDLLMSEAAWPAGGAAVHVGRNLTVQSRGPRTQLLNFTSVQGKLSIAPGVHLTLQRLTMSGWSVGSYLSLIAASPGAYVWVRDSVWHGPVCPDLPKLVAILSTQPRPLELPGYQTVKPSRWPHCLRGTCHPHAAVIKDWTSSRLVMSVAQGEGSAAGPYTVGYTKAVWTCDLLFSEACVARRGYAECRDEAIAMHRTGATSAYPQRRGPSLLAVLACVALCAVGGWHVLHRKHKAQSAAEEAEIVQIAEAFCGCTRDDAQGAADAAAEAPAGPSLLDTSSTATESDDIQLGQFLGAGSFGRVYAALWQGRTVAVKIVTHDQAAADKFAGEAALSLSLLHCNVVRTFHHFTIHEGGSGDDALAMLLTTDTSLTAGEGASPNESAAFSRFSAASGLSGTSFMVGATSDVRRAAAAVQRRQRRTWIVQELCDLGPLSKHLRILKAQCGDNTLDMGVVLGYSLDIAKGMAYLHRHNICHGDLKADNVLLMSATRADADGGFPGLGVAKVADFGLSRIMAANRTHLSTRTIGTITHMPPELLLDNQLTRECDLYSYGILMWETATGETLYPRMNPVMVMTKVLVENARPTFPPHVPDEYVNLARECWAHDVPARPTFDEVVVRLQGMLKRWTKRTNLERERSTPTCLDRRSFQRTSAHAITLLLAGGGTVAK